MSFTFKVRKSLLKLGAVYRVLSGRDTTSMRLFLSRFYLRGRGLEVGALHNPFPIPKGVRVEYVDRMTREDLLKHYPEHLGQKLVRVDHVTDGETLLGIPDNSQDFVIASHFLEHSEDPIGTLKNFIRVVKTGGILYLALPDKRMTFDRDREETSLEHLMKDHREGPQGSRPHHFREWVELVDKVEDREKRESEIDRLMAMSYSIHFHVFTAEGFLEMLARLRRENELAVDILAFVRNAEEFICVLGKNPN